MIVMVDIVVVQYFLVICERLVLPTGALLAQVGGSFGCCCVMGGLLVSIQVWLQGIVIHVRSIVQGEPFWCVLLVWMRRLETCRLMICILHENS